MSEAAYYVDTDVGNNGNTGLSPGAGNAVATLANAMSKLTGPMDKPCVIHCKGSVADTAGVAFSGKTSTPTNYIKIVVDQADRHAGAYNTGKYRLEFTGDNHALSAVEDAVIVEGLQIKHTVANGSGDSAIKLERSTAGATTAQVSHCIIKGVLSGTTVTCNGIFISTQTSDSHVWNNVIYNFVNGANANNGIRAAAINGTQFYYSNTVVNCHTGINNILGTGTIKNNYANGTSATYAGTWSTATTNAASDADTDADAALRNIAADTTTFTNVTGGSEDYHLPTGSPLLAVGTDTSGESSPLNFTTDIDGATRSVPWDVGADDLTSGAAAPAPTVNETMGAIVESVTMHMPISLRMMKLP